MALAVDAVSSAVGSGASSFTWSHTNAGNLLVVGVSWYKTASALSSLTYNSVSMVAVSGSLLQDGDYNTVFYYLVAPTAGTNTVAITFTGGVFDVGVGAVSFTGANQAIPYGTPATASGTSTTPSVNVSSSAGEIVIDTTIITHSGTYTVGGGQTSRWNAIASNGFVKVSGSTEGGAGTTTMSWSNTSSQFWVMSAVPIKPAGFQAAWARGSNVLVGVA